MVTFGVGLAAFNTGNNLIFLVFGFMLSLIVLSGILSEVAIRGIRVERRPPEHSFVGTTCLLELALTNKKKWIPSYSLEVEDIAQKLVTERRCYFLKVAARSQQVATYRRQLSRRGFLYFSGFRVSTRFPFGIFEKWRNLHIPGEMLVYPALLEEESIIQDGVAHGMELPIGQPGSGSEIGGLREYRMGEETRNIHWIRTAALGELVVREHERDASLHMTIRLDNQRPEDAKEQWYAEFERAISKVATMVVANVARGIAVEVVTRGSCSPLVLAGASVYPILRFLALLQPVEGDAAFGFSQRIPNTNLVVVQVSPAGVS